MVLRRQGPPPFEVMRKLRSEAASSPAQAGESHAVATEAAAPPPAPPVSVSPPAAAPPAAPRSVVDAHRAGVDARPAVSEPVITVRPRAETSAPPPTAVSRSAPSISPSRIEAEDAAYVDPQPAEAAAAPHYAQPSGQSQSIAADAAAPGTDESWLLKAKQPVVFRVPQGLVLAGVVGLVLVLAMVYWAGRSRGYHGAAGDAAGAGQPLLGAVTPVPVGDVPAGSSAASGGAGVPGAHESQANTEAASIASARRAGVDGRVAGRNYFVLAYYPKEQAEKLVAFLSTQGVDAAAVRGNNRRDFQVIALRGFDKSELASPERREYERQLKQVGRAWKERQRGATDLSDLYPDRFDGEPIAQIIYPSQ